MKSIIEEIYLGKRGSYSQIKISEEYERISAEVCRLTEKLKNQLTGKAQGLFEKLDCARGELSAESSMSNFIEGFKLGMLIAIEAFSVD